MSERRFDDQVVVITGAGRGLGRQYALLLGSLGARVVVNDPGFAIDGKSADHGAAEAVVAEICNAGGQAMANFDSVADPAGGQAIIDTAMDTWGRLDVLIHNAGNVRYGSLEEISFEDFKSVVDVHLMGAFHVVRPAFPLMARRRYGRVVLTGSIGGLYGTHNVVNYGVSKAGMIGLNNVIATEGAEKGIRSNIILPGAVTRMADGLDTSAYPPMGPEQVAPIVAWLAHTSCSISGEMLIAMAGRVARAFVAEAEGVYQAEWSIDDVAERIEEIRDQSRQWILPPGGEGYMAHLGRSFEMVKSLSGLE